jgi:hypothetical protein
VELLGELGRPGREASVISGEVHGGGAKALRQSGPGPVGDLSLDARPPATTTLVEAARNPAISGT